MLNIFKRKLRRGDLIEIALTADAQQYPDLILKDRSGETNIPGRFLPGYVIEVGAERDDGVKYDFISIAREWDKPNNKPINGGITVYSSAVQSYRKR
jgi:hypothetical protein